MPSLAACVTAMYSASAVDSVTNSCFHELHETMPPSMMNVWLEMAQWCSCEALSASVYPNRLCCSPPYVSATSHVPER